MSTTQDELKKAAAQAALKYVPEDTVIGVGSGTTVSLFIKELATIKHKIEGAIAASKVTEELLKSYGIPVCDLNSVGSLSMYIDGADEIDDHLYLIKGGGGALTREKICAAVTKKFLCIVDYSKQVKILGNHPVPIEVIPMARSYVAREMVKLGGSPEYRAGFVTDNGNVIIDIHNLKITAAADLERQINNIAGVVCNGLFANRPADLAIIATPKEISTIHAG